MTTKDINLTGVWNGRYSYPEPGLAAVPFVATLIERPGSLTGSTHEIGTLGERAGETLFATLNGQRSGNDISLVKTYDGLGGVYNMVLYQGVLSADGTEISGDWTIPGDWSGRFVMIRSGEAAVKRAQKVAERA